MELTAPLMDSCHEINKYNLLEAENSEWFTTFWTQEDAMDQMYENIDRHPIKVWWNTLGSMMYWKIGFYYGMGYSYGRFWTRLMGHPKWNADLKTVRFFTPEAELPEADALV